jgi:hypothetical protein
MSLEKTQVTVPGSGEHPEVNGDPSQPVTTGTIKITDAKNNPQLEAEAFAAKAQAVHKKVEGFKARVVNLGRQQLDAAIEADHHLMKAKVILCHGNFKKEQERWRFNKTITFSDRSVRRYMLLATYAKEIKMANVATLREAERLATALKDAADSEKAADKKKAGRAGKPPAPPTDAPALSAADLETQVLKAMHRFAEVDDQRALLSALTQVRQFRAKVADFGAGRGRCARVLGNVSARLGRVVEKSPLLGHAAGGDARGHVPAPQPPHRRGRDLRILDAGQNGAHRRGSAPASRRHAGQGTGPGEPHPPWLGGSGRSARRSRAPASAGPAG